MISIKHMFAGILVIGLTACSQNETSENIVWETLNQVEYSVSYPDYWELDESGNSNFTVLSPKSDEEDMFRENVNLVIRDLGGEDLDLAMFQDEAVAGIEQNMPSANVLSSVVEGNGDSECLKVVYTATQQSIPMQFMQHCWSMNGKVYILTFTSTPNDYEEYKLIADQIFNSFQIHLI